MHVRKSESEWFIGPSPAMRWVVRVLLAAGLVSFVVALVHWASFNPFHDSSVVLGCCMGGGLALCMGLVVGFVNLATPRVRIDLEARTIVVNNTRVPFALAGPVALWTREISTSGGPETPGSSGTATMLAIVFGTAEDANALVEEHRRRRRTPYRENADDEPITREIHEPWSMNINAGGPEDANRILANELAALWNNQVVNVTGRGEPDLSGAKPWLHPTPADLEALEGALASAEARTPSKDEDA